MKTQKITENKNVRLGPLIDELKILMHTKKHGVPAIHLQSLDQ
jgi:hypothetical protein